MTIDAQYDASMSISCCVYFRMNKLFEVKWFENEWNVWLNYQEYRHREAFPWHEKSYRLTCAGGNDNHLIVKSIYYYIQSIAFKNKLLFRSVDLDVFEFMQHIGWCSVVIFIHSQIGCSKTQFCCIWLKWVMLYGFKGIIFDPFKIIFLGICCLKIK